MIDHAPHTTQGCELLEQVSELRECDVCCHYHERWAGSGYPDQLAGGSITPRVQVVGLTDAFDPRLLACLARNIGAISQAVYASAS